MEIQHIEPFITATANVFDKLLGKKAEPQTPYILTNKELTSWDISGVIGLAGDSRGMIVVSLMKPLAYKITQCLVERKVNKIDEDVIDAIGELVNIIAGNAKKGLEKYRLVISLPSVIHGNNHSFSWPSKGGPIIGIPLKTEEGECLLSIGLENIIGQEAF